MGLCYYSFQINCAFVKKSSDSLEKGVIGSSTPIKASVDRLTMMTKKSETDMFLHKKLMQVCIFIRLMLLKVGILIRVDAITCDESESATGTRDCTLDLQVLETLVYFYPKETQPRHWTESPHRSDQQQPFLWTLQ